MIRGTVAAVRFLLERLFIVKDAKDHGCTRPLANRERMQKEDGREQERKELADGHDGRKHESAKGHDCVQNNDLACENQRKKKIIK